MSVSLVRLEFILRLIVERLNEAHDQAGRAHCAAITL